MSSKLTPTALPTPPKEYDIGYMDRLVKQIALEFTKSRAVTPFTCGSDLSSEAGFPISGLTIVNPPISSTGSPPDGFPEGSVWCDTTSENSLKIITSGPYTDQDSLNLANTTDPALGDALIGFRQSNASGILIGAVGRTVHEKLQETISVEDFGADPTGVADSTAAIQAAIDAAAASGGCVVCFTGGTYLIGATILMRDGVSIQGEGRNVTIIKLKNSSNCNLIDKHPSSVGVAIGVFDLTFDGNQDNNTQGGVIIGGAGGGPRGFAWTVERVIITKCRNAVHPAGVKTAFLISGDTFGQFKDIDVWLNDYCNVAMWVSSADAQFNNIYVGTNCRSSNQSLSAVNCGLYITGGGNNFIGCYFGGTQNGPHVYMDGASCGWNRFVGCIFDNAGTNAIFLGVGVYENIFSGCRIGNSSYTDGGTYDTVYSDTSGGNNLFSGCIFYTYLTVSPPPPRYAYFESSGTTGGNHIVGCEFVGTWTSGVDGRQPNSTTKFAACRGYDYTESNDFFASNSLRVGTKDPSTAIAGARIYSDGLASFSRSDNYALALRRLTNDGDVSVFLNSAGTISGAITITGATTAYNTSSDYRLKENIVRIENALDKNDLLNPVSFKWKSDGKLGQGFIAHELQEHFPLAVKGEKDATDNDGNPIYQGVDASFLIGHLVACVQELRVEIDNLKENNVSSQHKS